MTTLLESQWSRFVWPLCPTCSGFVGMMSKSSIIVWGYSAFQVVLSQSFQKPVMQIYVLSHGQKEFLQSSRNVPGFQDLKPQTILEIIALYFLRHIPNTSQFELNTAPMSPGEARSTASRPRTAGSAAAALEAARAAGEAGEGRAPKVSTVRLQAVSWLGSCTGVFILRKPETYFF